MTTVRVTLDIETRWQSGAVEGVVREIAPFVERRFAVKEWLGVEIVKLERLDEDDD
jgi:hypothetical protein